MTPERQLELKKLGDTTYYRDAAGLVNEAVARIEHLEHALDRIAHPLAAMQKDAEAQGNKLDTAMATSMANSANFLRGWAEEALKG